MKISCKHGVCKSSRGIFGFYPYHAPLILYYCGLRDLPLPANVDNERKMLDSSPKKASLAACIIFQGHDLMEKQPVQDADVYLLRMILVDRTDVQAAKIVRNLVDAIKNRFSSKLLIMNTVLSKPGLVPVSIEGLFRVRYITILQWFNHKEQGLYD